MTHSLRRCEIYEAAFGKDIDVFAVYVVGIDSFATLNAFVVLFEPFDIDLDIEVSGIREDGAVLKDFEVLFRDNRRVSCCRDKDITDFGGFVHCHHIVAVHVGFKRTSWVNLGYDYLCSETVSHLCETATAVSVSGDDKPFAADERVRRYHHSRKCTLARAVDIVELVFHRGVVDGNDGEFEFAFRRHGTQSVYARGRLLAAADYVTQKFASLGVKAVNEVHSVVDCDGRV